MEITPQPEQNIIRKLFSRFKGKDFEKNIYIVSIISSVITLGIFWLYLYVNIANGYQARGNETLAFLIMSMIAWVGLFIPTAILFFFDKKKAILPSLPFALIIIFFLGSAIALIDQKTGIAIVDPYRKFAEWSYNTIKRIQDPNAIFKREAVFKRGYNITPTIGPLPEYDAKIIYPNGDEILCSNKDTEIKWSVPTNMDIVTIFIMSPTLRSRIGIFKATNNELASPGDGDIPWNMKDDTGSTIPAGEAYKIYIEGKYGDKIIKDTSDKSFSIINCEG